ncbi:hypothetical protein HYZ70_02060 [Candidatus Curtissbacteria bacterium]|nr:hypothetical protein [Candidatus Curtissbacteria bacterium]
MLKKFYRENKIMVISGVIALTAIVAVLLFIRSEVDRFIFSMPIFAGWILFNILMLPDEEQEKIAASVAKETKRKKKTVAG